MRLFITLFYSLLLFCILFSCRDESSSIGAKWVDSSFMNAVTDTCTVTLSTLLSDSLIRFARSGDIKTIYMEKLRLRFMRNMKYLLILLMKQLNISLTLLPSNGILQGIIWAIHWFIIVLSYLVCHKESHWKIMVTFLIRPMLIITGIIFLLLFLYVLLPDTVTRCMNYVCLTNGEKNGLI